MNYKVVAVKKVLRPLIFSGDLRAVALGYGRVEKQTDVGWDCFPSDWRIRGNPLGYPCAVLMRLMEPAFGMSFFDGLMPKLLEVSGEEIILETILRNATQKEREIIGGKLTGLVVREYDLARRIPVFRNAAVLSIK